MGTLLTAVLFAAATTHTAAAPAALTDDQRQRLVAWFGALGASDGASFGGLIARAAERQLGVPYLVRPPQDEPEVLRIELDHFECVSFVETTLALARCAWMGRRTEDCFVGEVAALRYRDGQLAGYGSKLHYFTDWLFDNERRGRLQGLTQGLGGVRSAFAFSYMTDHPEAYPALRHPEILAEIRATEGRLSAGEVVLIPRDRVRAIEAQLQDGDLIAVAGSKPGLFISHAGFARRAGGTLRLLHASSHHKRVLLTQGSLADYILARPERRGIVVARPVAPTAEPLSP